MEAKPSHIPWTWGDAGASFLLFPWHSQEPSGLPAVVKVEHTHVGKVSPSLVGPVVEREALTVSALCPPILLLVVNSS